MTTIDCEVNTKRKSTFVHPFFYANVVVSIAGRPRRSVGNYFEWLLSLVTDKFRPSIRTTLVKWNLMCVLLEWILIVKSIESRKSLISHQNCFNFCEWNANSFDIQSSRSHSAKILNLWGQFALRFELSTMLLIEFGCWELAAGGTVGKYSISILTPKVSVCFLLNQWHGIFCCVFFIWSKSSRFLFVFFRQFAGRQICWTMISAEMFATLSFPQ